MFSYCCYQPQIENVLEKDMDNLRIRIEDMRNQINNIYEMLEVLTNERKAKNILEQFSNNDVPKENYTTPTANTVK